LRVERFQRSIKIPFLYVVHDSKWVKVGRREQQGMQNIWTMFPSLMETRNCWSKRRTAVFNVSLVLHEQIKGKEWGTTHILLGAYKSRKSIWSPREIAAMRKQFVLRIATL
jgi:hypothetical protein